MSDIKEHVSHLSSIWEGEETTEEPLIIDIDSPLSIFSEKELSEVLQLAHENYSYFEDFEITIHTDRTGEQPIIQSSGNLHIHNTGFDILQEAFDDEHINIQHWRQIATDVLHDNEIKRLAEFLFQWSEAESISFHLDCIIDKSEIGERLKSELDPEIPVVFR